MLAQRAAFVGDIATEFWTCVADETGHLKTLKGRRLVTARTQGTKHCLPLNASILEKTVGCLLDLGSAIKGKRRSRDAGRASSYSLVAVLLICVPVR
jgi:hypothetical protein